MSTWGFRVGGLNQKAPSRFVYCPHTVGAALIDRLCRKQTQTRRRFDAAALSVESCSFPLRPATPQCVWRLLAAKISPAYCAFRGCWLQLTGRVRWCRIAAARIITLRVKLRLPPFLKNPANEPVMLHFCSHQRGGSDKLLPHSWPWSVQSVHLGVWCNETSDWLYLSGFRQSSNRTCRVQNTETVSDHGIITNTVTFLHS